MARNRRVYFEVRMNSGEDGKRGLTLAITEQRSPSPPTLVYGFYLRNVVAFVYANYPANVVNGFESNDSFHKTVEKMLRTALDEMGYVPTGGDSGAIQSDSRPV